MRGDFADEARRFEDLDKAAMRQIQEQPIQEPDNILDPMYSFKQWIREQETPTIALLLTAIALDLARRVYPDQARDVQRAADGLKGQP